MLRIAYISPTGYAKPTKKSDEEIIRELAMETVEVQKHLDQSKAKLMFAAEREELKTLKKALPEVVAGTYKNLEWLKRECDLSGHASEQALL